MRVMSPPSMQTPKSAFERKVATWEVTSIPTSSAKVTGPTGIPKSKTDLSSFSNETPSRIKAETSTKNGPKHRFT
eukprot:CAMPEP_0194155770 /NCGR_PEP_ID=MMETSP0152-20130528/65834_1 /TAXON_ID=1049557 /ORGANISM="Thalassiothrix antarctica, Strain L6-D1" /LENGTH=74 /DNA_ID=CAMNT_0038862921 /DNA_START=82 /DNA_END=306 /DNA_ORIENTATION=-